VGLIWRGKAAPSLPPPYSIIIFLLELYDECMDKRWLGTGSVFIFRLSNPRKK
jgi:hypothetical protein